MHLIKVSQAKTIWKLGFQTKTSIPKKLNRKLKKRIQSNDVKVTRNLSQIHFAWSQLPGQSFMVGSEHSNDYYRTMPKITIKVEKLEP